MCEAANVQTVQQLYADFGRGDVPAILARLDPDVAWANAGPSAVPYARKRRGIDEVRDFFASIAASVEVQVFEPREYFSQGNRVLVIGRWSGRTKPTGRAFASDWVMAWTLKGGKITSFQSYEDTHQLAQAFA